MTVSWFRYVRHEDVAAREAEGWMPCGGRPVHHDAYSTLMELADPSARLAAAHALAAECERKSEAAAADLHEARLSILQIEDEIARTN
jgi:hypothetical protein